MELQLLLETAKNFPDVTERYIRLNEEDQRWR
jgi:hypothetical protein